MSGQIDVVTEAMRSHAGKLDALASDAVQGVEAGRHVLTNGDAYGELKRLYVRPEARGRGAARRIVEFLESAARAQGCDALVLETGPYQPEALAFYARQGYGRCGPFGDYPDHPLSVFMRKRLEAPAGERAG